MKHKVSELEGALLDVAVAMAEDDPISGDLNPGTPRVPLPYSTDWEYGGPIIAREQIELSVWGAQDWLAGTYAETDDPDCRMVTAKGPTPLIAAMRAYAASRFGEEVELP